MRSCSAKVVGSEVYKRIRRMRDASRYIDDLITVNFPEFEDIMYRARGEQSQPATVMAQSPLSGIYPTECDGQQGLVLERVQPEPRAEERTVRQVDYLDLTIKRDSHGWHCDIYDKRDAMPSQSGTSRVPNIRTELSEACKYGIVHSQMHRFSRRLRSVPLFCKATGKLLAHMIDQGYDRCKL